MEQAVTDKPFDIYSVLKEETKKRCTIVNIETQASQFTPVKSEQFLLLKEVSSIDFSIYFRIENYAIEYIKKDELCAKYLDEIWSSFTKSKRPTDICILKSDFDLFQRVISEAQVKKINALVTKHPELDKKVLASFLDLNGASQLIVKGGINQQTANKVRSRVSEMIQNVMNNDKTLATISKMITIDPTLYDHSTSVSMFASMIAGNCITSPLPKDQVELIGEAGLYHDVGKFRIPNEILNKPGKFTPEEFEIMKKHTVYGKEELDKIIAEGVDINPLISTIACEHHEKMNGKGYPYQKKGKAEDNPEEGIHLYSRIMSIADIYSALLMKRVYKNAFTPQDAIKIMTKSASEDLDVPIFTSFVDKLLKSFDSIPETKQQR